MNHLTGFQPVLLTIVIAILLHRNKFAKVACNRTTVMPIMINLCNEATAESFYLTTNMYARNIIVYVILYLSLCTSYFSQSRFR